MARYPSIIDYFNDKTPGWDKYSEEKGASELRNITNRGNLPSLINPPQVSNTLKTPLPQVNNTITTSKAKDDVKYDKFWSKFGLKVPDVMGGLKDKQNNEKNTADDFIQKYGYLPKNATKQQEQDYYNKFSSETGTRNINQTDKVFDKSRILSNISDAMAPMNKDSMDMLIQANAQMKGSKVGNTLTGLVGNVAGLAMNPGGGMNGKNLLNVTDDLVEGSVNRLAPNIGKFSSAVTKGAIDGGIGGALDSMRQNDIENIGQNVVYGAIGGGTLRGIAPTVGAINNKLTKGALNSVDGMFDIKAPDSGVYHSTEGNLKPKFEFKPKVQEVNLPEVKTPELPKYSNPKVRNVELDNAYKQYDNAVRAIQNEIGHYQGTDEEVINAMDKLGIDLFAITDNIKRLEEGQVKPTHSYYDMGRKAGVFDTVDKNNIRYLNQELHPKAFNDTIESIKNKPINNTIEDVKPTIQPIDEVKNTLKPKLIQEADGESLLYRSTVPQSRHATETMQKSNNILEEVKQELAKEDFSYEKTNNQQDYNNAVKFAESETAYNDYLRSSGTTHQDTANGIALIQKLQKDLTNVTDEATKKEILNRIVDTTKKLSGDLTNAGKTVQAAKIVNSLSPEGKLLSAQREIKNISDKIIKDKGINIDKEVNTGITEMRMINDEAIDIISKEIKPKTGDEIALDIDESFVKSTDKAIKQTLKDSNIDLNKLIKGHYASDTTNNLVDTLVSKGGYSEAEAKQVADYVYKRMDEITTDKKQKALENMLKTRKKSVKKTDFQRIIELSNMGAFTKDDMRQAIINKYKLPELTAEDSNFILTKMKELETVTDDRQRNIIQGEVKKLIDNKVPASMMDKVDSVRYLNMLLNPKSLIKNVAGNAINTTVGAGRDFIGSGIDKMLASKTGTRTTGNIDLKTFGNSAKKEFGNTIDDYKRGIDTSFGATKEGARGNALRDIPVLNKLEDFLKVGLQLGDRPFYEGARNNFLANYMKLNNINDITKIPNNVLEEAHNVGLEATYQQRTALGDWISQGKNSDSKVVSTAVKTLLPFSKTPSAILDTAINYTPVGAIKGGLKINKLLKNTDVENALNLQRKGVNELSSGILGTGMGIGGYALANAGLMTGDLSKDNETAALQRQTGMQPYALKVGDTYNSLSFAQPAASPLMVGADIAQNGVNPSMIGAAVNSITDNSYLSGLKNIASSLSNGDGWNEVPKAVASNFVSQLLPLNSLASNINKTIDPTMRDTYSQGFVDKNIKSAMAKYPGFAQLLEPATDTVGQEKTYNEGFGPVGGAINNFINPFNTTKFTPTDVEKKALDMYYKDGSTAQIPKYAPKTISYGKGKQYTPTAEENRLFNSMIANALKSAKNTPEDYQKAMTKASTEWRNKIKQKHNLK